MENKLESTRQKVVVEQLKLGTHLLKHLEQITALKLYILKFAIFYLPAPGKFQENILRYMKSALF